MKSPHFATARTTIAAFASLALTGGLASAANVIVNGGFETGDTSSWTTAGFPSSGVTISSTSPLSGSFSAVQQRVTGQLAQTFTPFTGVATTSFIFTATDPGGALDRSMNFNLRDSDYVTSDGTLGSQINIRLVDLNTDGDGDIQIFNSATTWETVLTDAVTFGSLTSFSLTINDYGTTSNLSYDLTVGSKSASNLSFLQVAGDDTNGFDDFNQISFVASQLAVGSSLKFDNVAVVPEPSAALLGGLACLFLLRRRR